MEKEAINQSQVQIQDSMWIEIIKGMESIYAELANTQAEIERKSHELLEAKEFTDDIIRSMANALIVTDSQGNIEMVNQATLDLLGYKENELIGKPIGILFAEREAEKKLFPRDRHPLEGGSIRDVEINCISKSGGKIPMTFSGSAIRSSDGEFVGFVSVAKDLRETKRLAAEAATAAAERAKAAELERAYNELHQLQTQLIQSEKLAMMGRLAAGVAHEINNPISGVLTYIKLILKKIEKGPCDLEEIRRYLSIMEKETSRCGRIVRNLLDFARQTEPDIKPIDTKRVLEQSLSLLQDQLVIQDIKIIKALPSSLPTVMADFGQLQQVFMNIILNAAQAMPNGGELRICIDRRDRGFINIEFADTGCGISEEDLPKIFDPFFTTKDGAKDVGLGLGLSIVQGIIDKHHGSIAIESQAGKGTTFTIRLPVNKTAK